MDVISTPVTPKPADSGRQEEMGKSLPFARSPGLSCATVAGPAMGWCKRGDGCALHAGEVGVQVLVL